MELSDQDVKDVKKFYERQRNRLLGEMSHINLMLKKLAGEAEGDLEDLQNNYRDLIGPRKRGPKSVWGNFIINRLKKVARPMTYSELINDAMRLHDLDDSKEPSARASILNSAFRLRTIHGRIESLAQAGRKQKHLILTSWLDNDGHLISPYMEEFVGMTGNRPLAVNMDRYIVE
jgi:hypothetical protein